MAWVQYLVKERKTLKAKQVAERKKERVLRIENSNFARVIMCYNGIKEYKQKGVSG